MDLFRLNRTSHFSSLWIADYPTSDLEYCVEGVARVCHFFGVDAMAMNP